MKKIEECKCPHIELRRALKERGYNMPETATELGYTEWRLRQRFQGYHPFSTTDMEMLLKLAGKKWEDAPKYFPPYSEVARHV